MIDFESDSFFNEIENNKAKSEPLPARMPLLPVRDLVIFPEMVLPLYIGRKRSLKAVESAIEHDRYIFVAAQKDPLEDDPGMDGIFSVGTACRILRHMTQPDGNIRVLLQGIKKGKIRRFLQSKECYHVLIDEITDQEITKVEIEHQALMRSIREYCQKILSLRGEYSEEIGALLEEIDDPGKLSDLVASNLKLKIDEAQELLETQDPIERLRLVNTYLARELDLSTVQAKIQSTVREEISKNQRDYFLREQVRAIHRELGDFDEKALEIEEYKKKIKKAKMPKEGVKEAEKQLKRLEQMHPESAEATVIRNYLDWLIELPWKKSTRDVIDIPEAIKVLNKYHYGLERVKDRILEYLSVRKLNPDKKGQILCFVGPPGVGKTSLGKAIAEAMGRKFYRISLGGIRDEAEIRGHRRTYIGAMPGRIIQGLKQVRTNNPVFMMDEIDKIGADFRGDPSAALLEALDPEQNTMFSDHFINIPFDLSNVLFILTANITETIPAALLDRMEVIQLPGYTVDEKLIIAKKFLVPRQKTDAGLDEKSLSISDKAIEKIVLEYTAESGLRNLEREIGAICRKTARKIAEGKKGPFVVTTRNLATMLGPPKFIPELDKEESQIGLATGLAWTYAGGEVLYVEVVLFDGKGELVITGQVGEVMQESARAALSYTRANRNALGIAKDIFEHTDIHIHVPAGAIPKDGPSAGVAMVTALVSALTKRAVNTSVAMTGEMSLRGRVLPIGGLREKAVGASRAGISTILFPAKNIADLVDIPANIRKKIEFIPVKSVDEVLAISLVNPPARIKKMRKRISAVKK